MFYIKKDMVKLILDSTIGNQSYSFTFKKTMNLDASFTDICKKFKISPEERSKFALIIKKTGEFVNKIGELGLLIL